MKFSNLLLATVVAVSASTSVASIDNGLVAHENIAEPKSLLRGLKTVKDKEGKNVEVPDDAPAAAEPAPAAEPAVDEPAPAEPAPKKDEASK